MLLRKLRYSRVLDVSLAPESALPSIPGARYPLLGIALESGSRRLNGTGPFVSLKFLRSLSFIGNCVNLGYATLPKYRKVRHPRVRRISLLLGSVLTAGSRRLPIAVKFVIRQFGVFPLLFVGALISGARSDPSTCNRVSLEIGDSPSFIGECVNLGFATSPLYRESRYHRVLGIGLLYCELC